MVKQRHRTSAANSNTARSANQRLRAEHPSASRFDAATDRMDAVVENLAVGLGDPSRDKSTHTRPKATRRLTIEEKEWLFEQSWICRRICEAYGFEATRKWTQIKLGKEQKPEVVSAFEKYDKRLQVRSAFRRASVWSQAQGGAVILMLINDGQPIDQPIDYARIKSIDGLDVLDRYEVYPHTAVSFDPLRPDSYLILDSTRLKGAESPDLTKAKGTIHPDRVLRFDGFELPRRTMQRNSNWGGSVLDNIWSAFSRYDSAYASVEALVHEFDIFIYKMKGLGEMMASTNDKAQVTLRKRMNAMQFSKSNLKGLVLDATDEEASFASRNVTGLGPVLESFKAEMIGASGLPHTVVFGESAGGLGSTGESEDSTWVKMVEQYQIDKFHDHIERLYQLIWLAKDGPTKGKEPKDWSFEFNPLYRRSLKSELEMKSTQATIDGQYLQMEALTKDEIRQSRFGGANFNHETTLNVEAWEAAQKAQEFDPSLYGDPAANPEAALPPEGVPEDEPAEDMAIAPE